MDQTLTVVIFAVVVFAISIIAGRVPFIIKKSMTQLHFLIAFSAGVMLGVLFIMLMPEAIERTVDAGHDFEFVSYMILLGFLVLLIIDCLVKRYLKSSRGCCTQCDHNITSLSAFAGLAIHSFFDGLALAAAFVAGEDVGLMVLIALCLHKAVVVFSLSSTLLMSSNKKQTWNYILAFSVVSPLATIISYLFLDTGNISFAGPALCVSVGIFMFVTLVDMLPEAFHMKNKDNTQLMALILGLIVVVIVSFVSHQLMGGLEI
ncbi:MAG: ZIP family metal transporter [archaeon]|nr:ZIP family metal transporter [archaeon]